MVPHFSRLFWRALRRGFDALAREEGGGIAIFIATAIVPLVGFLGLAVDTTRGYLVKSRLSQALDAAGLAGGRVIFSENRDADIRMYFDANFPPGYMGATVTGPAIDVDGDNEKLTLSASAVIDTTFLRVLGIENMTVRSAVEVTRQTQLLDVVLAIDVSGSMTSSAGGGKTRIQAARDAANSLVGILFGDDETKDLLKIGLVPWNSKVNVTRNGVTFNSSLTASQTVPTFKNPVTGATQNTVYFANNSPVPLLNAPPAGWKGCVYNRYKNDGDATDDADIHEGSLLHAAGDWVAWQPIGAEGEPVSGSARCSSAPFGQECTACFTRGITALQNTKTGITNAINQLLSPDGNTNVPAGLGWAWRVLTPAAPWNEADPNPLYRRQQAIVLLTDGENVGGYGDGYKATFGVNSAAQSAMDARTRLLAQNIKASGVVLYVIQFANNNSAMQALLKNVATGPDKPYYNYAPDAATLQQVFREVANNLSELRLSK
jgi:Flp pilus assembly protein TadG